jgi:hypothetical protein
MNSKSPKKPTAPGSKGQKSIGKRLMPSSTGTAESRGPMLDLLGQLDPNKLPMEPDSPDLGEA